MDSIKGKFNPCNFREILDLTEKQKQQYLDLQIAQAPVVSEVEECECDVIADIFQKAIKRKGLTKEQVKSINKEMLIEVREGRPHTILESIERSFREIKQFKEGKTQFKTLKESQTLWDKWAEEVDDEENE